MKVMLFTQRGDERPKCVARYVTARYADRFAEAVRVAVRHIDNIDASKPIIAAALADHWWLIEAENAEDGRKVIAHNDGRACPEFSARFKECPVTCEAGRILASGGRTTTKGDV